MMPIFKRLEVIDDPQPQDAALNMATDEALLDHLADAAMLRIYRWRRAAVSFGYFDPWASVSTAYPGRDLVRRWTGGGIVEHGQDFTYSILVPRTHALTALQTEESYRLLHGVVARAIAAAAPTLPPLEESPASANSREISRACFVQAVRHDLVLAGNKVAGAAQRRTRRGWLHQGSILLPGEVGGIYEDLRQTLPAALSARHLPRLMQPEEAAAAGILADTKYRTDAWLRRF